MWHLGFSRLFLSSKELNVKSLIIVLSALRGKKHKIKLLSNSVIVSNVIIISLLIWYRPLLALRHQQSAGKALKEVVSANPIEGGFFCLNPLIVDYQQRQLLLHGVEDLRKAARYSSNQSHTYLLLGRAFCLLGDYESAIPAFQRFAELRPKNPLGYLEMGFALLQACPPNGKCPHGLNTYDAWRNAGVRAEDFLALAEKARQKEDYETALFWYKNAHRMGVDLRGTIAYIRYLNAKKNGDPQALNFLRGAVLRETGWLSEAQRIQALYEYAHEMLMQSRFDEAEKSYYKTIKLIQGLSQFASLYDTIIFHLGSMYAWSGRTDKAIPYLRQTIARNPSNFWAYINMGIAYYWQNPKETNRTKEYFDQGIFISGNNESAWTAVVQFWAERGEVEQKNLYCERSLSIGIRIKLCVDQ